MKSRYTSQCHRSFYLAHVCARDQQVPGGVIEPEHLLLGICLAHAPLLDLVSTRLRQASGVAAPAAAGGSPLSSEMQFSESTRSVISAAAAAAAQHGRDTIVVADLLSVLLVDQDSGTVGLSKRIGCPPSEILAKLADIAETVPPDGVSAILVTSPWNVDSSR
jgi:hypothetical protein